MEICQHQCQAAGPFIIAFQKLGGSLLHHLQFVDIALIMRVPYTGRVLQYGPHARLLTLPLRVASIIMRIDFFKRALNSETDKIKLGQYFSLLILPNFYATSIKCLTVVHYIFRCIQPAQ